MFRVLCCYLMLFCLHVQASEADLTKQFTTQIAPILEQRCISCHGPKKERGGIRLDILGHDLVNDPDAADLWHEVMNQIAVGDMPPKRAEPLTLEESTAILEWGGAALARAEQARLQKSGRVVVRRLNRDEYIHTLGELLGVPVADLPALEELPRDRFDHGYDNDGHRLDMSPLHIEQYIAVGRQALARAIDHRPERPGFERWRWDMIEDTVVTKDNKGKERRVQKPYTLVGAGPVGSKQPSERTAGFEIVTWGNKHSLRGDWLALGDVNLKDISHKPRFSSGVKNFVPVETGTYRLRFRIGASGTHPLHLERPAIFEVQHMPMLKSIHRSSVLATKADPDIIECEVYLEAGVPFSFRFGEVPHSYGHGRSKVPKGQELHASGARLFVDWMEIEGPCFAFHGWPSPAQRQLVPSGSLVGGDAKVEEVIEDFYSRAFRRPVSRSVLATGVKLYQNQVQTGRTALEAVETSFLYALASPRFLYLQEPNATDALRDLDDFELATRLSYFLWRTMPDQELFELAAQGQLSKPAILVEQVDRLLDDHRSKAFIAAFADQWLGLNKLEDFSPDKEIYPDWDGELASSMMAETHAFIGRIVRGNRSVLEVLDADYVMINERLAQHYGIPGVKGSHIRPVKVAKNGNRGGIIGQASILCLTSNGTRTSPVRRGVWVLERLLDSPPPPPPPNAGEIDNKIPGVAKLSMRERLAAHRKIESCASCHNNIDPIGLALESYNGIGRWVEYEASGNPDKPLHLGALIDATGGLPNGDKVDGAVALRQGLFGTEQKRFVAGFVRQMLSFAVGREADFADEELVGELHKKLQDNNFQARVLIKSLVTSSAFQRK